MKKPSLLCVLVPVCINKQVKESSLEPGRKKPGMVASAWTLEPEEPAFFFCLLCLLALWLKVFKISEG